MEATLKRIGVIANNVRIWSEEKAKELGHWSDLCGTCAIASAELHRRLKKAGIDSKIAMSHSVKNASHCFVISNGHIVDVTATQFGMNRIEIRKITGNMVRTHSYWKHERTFDSVKSLKICQNSQLWPEDQIPK